MYEYKDRKIQDWLHLIRLEEAKQILKYLPKNKRLQILEIGGGDGYIASIISNHGHDVTSIDLEPRSPQYYPVKKVTGSKLNYPNQNYEVVFSSNVLEHIKELDIILSEVIRILKKNGIMINTIPTISWRIFTSVWHYYLLVIRFFNNYIIKKKSIGYSVKVDDEIGKKDHDIDKNYPYRKVNLKHLFFQPHGIYPSSLHEFYYFSTWRWLKLFKKHDYEIIDHYRSTLCYSGHGVLKFKFVKLRKFLAKHFFSGTHVYIIKPR